MDNIDPRTLASFGDEWSQFDQSGMSDHEAHEVYPFSKNEQCADSQDS